MTELCWRDGSPPVQGRALTWEVAVKRAPLGSPITGTIPSLSQVTSSIHLLPGKARSSLVCSVRQFPPAGTAKVICSYCRDRKF